MKTCLLWCLLASVPACAAAQEAPAQDTDYVDLTAGRRVFTEAGPGLRAIREGPDGRVYLLVSPQPGLLVFTAEGKPVMQLGAGLTVGLSCLSAGFTIGIVGDAGVRASGQQPRAFVGMMMMLIFAEVLGIYGLIVSLLLLTGSAKLGEITVCMY